MIKKVILFMGAFTLMMTVGKAQGSNQNDGQFFLNSYLYNPAFTGIRGDTELTTRYRKQLINFDGAPSTASINLQMPTNEKVVLGFNVASHSEALLRNTSFSGTFAYIVPVSKNESLRFAMSAGMGLTKLDLTAEELNTHDQAILNAAGNSYYADGRFGFVYSRSRLKLGISLPQLFQSNPLQSQFNELAASNLKNRTYSVSYRFDLDHFDNFSVEPYTVYHQKADAQYNAWEAATIVSYRDKMWTGVNYHQKKGLSLLVGVDVIGKFNFSYGFEFPAFNSNTGLSAHELQLAFRFGASKTNRAYPQRTAEIARPPGS